MGAPLGTRRRLTARQLEILEHLSRPHATQARVAAELGISEQTIKNHLQSVYDRLDVRSLAQAIRVVRHQLRTRVR